MPLLAEENANMHPAMALVILIAVPCIIIFGPWIFIWSLNTIFGLDIEWHWKLWLAVHGLFLMVNTTSSTVRNK